MPANSKKQSRLPIVPFFERYSKIFKLQIALNAALTSNDFYLDIFEIPSVVLAKLLSHTF